MSFGPDWMGVCHAAISLSAEERKDLEKRLASTPDDLELRVKLAGADFLSIDPESVARRAVHLAWLVKHHPDVHLGGFAFVPDMGAPREYAELRQLWLDALAARPDDLRVAKAAGSFLSFFDRELAIDVYRRAAAADPENAHWHDSLGNLYANLAKWSDDASHALEHAKQAVASYEAVLRLVASDWQQLARVPRRHELRASNRILNRRERGISSICSSRRMTRASSRVECSSSSRGLPSP